MCGICREVGSTTPERSGAIAGQPDARPPETQTLRRPQRCDQTDPNTFSLVNAIGEVLAARMEWTSKPQQDRFCFGIEEEYFLVDNQTGEAVEKAPQDFFASVTAATDGAASHEFMQCQVEIATPPYVDMTQSRSELSYIRRILSRIAASYGLAILACGTHPTSQWQSAIQTDKERYDRIMTDLQMVGKRTLVCGMHVHVALPDPSRRVEIMCRLIPTIPLFLALSTSSPFWQGCPTGLKSYRSAANNELPRSGMPEPFDSAIEYENYVQSLVRSGAIEDSSYIWWILRPSAKYPTLELRAPDCCTRIEDAIAIAALYRVLVRHFYREPADKGLPTLLSRALAIENKWRAARYGIGATFVSEEGPVSVTDFLERVIAMTADDAEALGCASEVASCRAIIARGTSADTQLRIFEKQASRDSPEAAMAAVIDWIAAITRAS